MTTLTLPMEALAEILQLQLTEGGRANLTVTGSSMHPTFRHRMDSVVLVPGVPRKKDVILYKRDNGAYVLHRIVQVKDTYICSGDNQWQPEPVRQEQVIAVVDGFTRNGKEYTNHYLPYGLWVWFWVGIFPIRRPILAVRHKLGKLWRKLNRRK